uniref:Uncharacterized protein n=1 Tax=Romanomermis culicivorax TaxID=13658 RepID=A0A915J9Q2_ROMCU
MIVDCNVSNTAKDIGLPFSYVKMKERNLQQKESRKVYNEYTFLRMNERVDGAGGELLGAVVVTAVAELLLLFELDKCCEL